MAEINTEHRAHLADAWATMQETASVLDDEALLENDIETILTEAKARQEAAWALLSVEELNTKVNNLLKLRQEATVLSAAILSYMTNRFGEKALADIVAREWEEIHRRMRDIL